MRSLGRLVRGMCGMRGMRELRRVVGVAAVPLLAAVLGGCGPEYERLDINGVVRSDLGGNVDRARIDVPEGMIVKAHIVAWNDDDEAMNLRFRVVDNSLIEATNVVSQHDYAFIGKKAGKTQIQFQAGDTVVLTVEATVTEQPKPVE